MILLFDEKAGESNNKFHKGLNVTIRNGTKYVNRLVIEERVDFKNLKNEHLGEGIAVGMLLTKLKNIPQGILDLEHDVNCRTLKGIIRCLNAVYPDDINEDTLVTVIFLNV